MKVGPLFFPTAFSDWSMRRKKQSAETKNTNESS